MDKPNALRAQLPDGAFTFRLPEIRLEHTQQGRPALVWTLLVTSGAHQNQQEDYWQVITPQSLDWLAHNLAACGVDIMAFPLARLPQYLPQLRGCRVAGRIATVSGHRKLSFDQRLEPAELSGPTDEALPTGLDLPIS